MKFEIAIENVKHGFVLSRGGWRAGEFVSMTECRTLRIGDNAIWSEHIEQVALANGGEVKLSPYFKKSYRDTVYMGWTPTTEDMFADDWFIYEDADY